MAKKEVEMEMTFYEHLDELRKRIIIIAVIILIATVICFAYVEDIIFFLTNKAENLDLIYTTPAEAFMSQIRLSFFVGALLTLPFTLHQIFAFVRPALRKKEKKRLSFCSFLWSYFFIRVYYLRTMLCFLMLYISF